MKQIDIQEQEDNLYTDVQPLKTILFYVRLTDCKDDEVIKVLKDCMLYVLHTQNTMGKPVVGTIYIEKWVYNLIKNDIRKLSEKYAHNMIKVWPILQNISK